MQRALLYDGLSARGRTGAADYLPDGLRLSCDDGLSEYLPLAALARGTTRDGQVTIHRDDQPDWRLVLYDPPDDWMRSLRVAGRPGRRTILAYAGTLMLIAAAGAGLWLAGGRLLDVLAPAVPHRILEPVGRALVEQLGGGRRCALPAGQEALDRLVDRLRPPSGFVEPVRVIVADVPMINAFAAPGGQIVVFRGLLDQAESSDELAGVLAHELTHVQLRHPTKALLRQAGLSTLFRSVAGDIGQAADLALVLEGSRDAERAADAGALDLLRQAQISPDGFEDFFKRMEEKTAPVKKSNAGVALIEKLGSFVATHPGGPERLAAIKQAKIRAWPATDAMSGRDWDAVGAICDRIDTDSPPKARPPVPAW